MKIIEDSASRLVLKEGALTKRIVGGVMLVAGIGLVVAGLLGQKILIAVGAALSIFGVLFALLSKSDVVVADIQSKQLTVTFTSLKNRSGQSQACSFSDVASVVLTQDYRTTTVPGANQSNGISFGAGPMNTGNTQTQILMTLTLQLHTGATITIANEQHQATAGLGVSLNKLPALGQKLADTLGVPFQETGSPTLSQAIHSVVQAVRGDSSQGETTASFSPAVPTQPTPVSGMNSAPPAVPSQNPTTEVQPPSAPPPSAG